MSKMLTEIREQPAALERTLAAGVKSIAGLRRLSAGKPPKFMIIVARGTSDNAGQFGRYLSEITLGIPVSLAAPSVFTLYDAHMDLTDVLVVGISQSGESTDINCYLERARELGALTVGITNEAQSTLAKLADCTLLVRAGMEKSVAATKTYTGQVLLLYLLVHALGGRARLEAHTGMGCRGSAVGISGCRACGALPLH
jgi:glucosamine--fructose-6-phosphate aminotransferase (isomerizing)